MKVTKQQILVEIRRTAEENRGVPLGERRFLAQTGIARADWMGKIWARWGDAVREAGFEANAFQGAHDESVILERYIELTRELGRFPVNAELRMRSRSHPGFPSHTVFSGKFGGKTGLVSQVLAYCQGRTGYEDVAELCEKYLSTESAGADPVDANTDGNVGYVYLMKSGRYYKIGRSNSAGRREYELAIQLPEKLSTVHVIRTDDPAGIEAYWHHRFKHKRKGGEWFELDSTDIAAFRRRKFM